MKLPNIIIRSREILSTYTKHSSILKQYSHIKIQVLYKILQCLDTEHFLTLVVAVIIIPAHYVLFTSNYLIQEIRQGKTRAVARGRRKKNHLVNFISSI